MFPDQRRIRHALHGLAEEAGQDPGGNADNPHAPPAGKHSDCDDERRDDQPVNEQEQLVRPVQLPDDVDAARIVRRVLDEFRRPGDSAARAEIRRADGSWSIMLT